MKYLKRYWVIGAVALVLVYFFKPDWLKFRNGGGITGGTTGGPVTNSAGSGGEY